MGLVNFTACNLLQVLLGFVVFQRIACDCLFPDSDFPNGRIKYEAPSDVNETFAEDLYILQFECGARYTLVGRQFIQCDEDVWSDEVPFCTFMECSRPPDIENARYEVKSGVSDAATLGSTVVYTCKEGYELNDTDTSTLRCVIDKKNKRAKWKGELPSCKEKTSCPDPGVSKHGTRRGKCCFSGTSLRFYCYDGYELVGDDTIQCMPSGRWSAFRPLCKPFDDHCELPPKIPHGLVIGDKMGDYFVPDEEAQVLCEPGYKCKGLEYVLCEEGGEWESEFGECTEIFCDPPPPLGNGTILELQSTNLTSFPYNFEITYVCDKGYRLIGDSWRVCGKRGWSGKTPVCEVAQCPDPGSPENGNKEGQNYTVGSSVQFSCFYGYHLLGSIDRYCLPNGQWTGELARCDLESNYCPNPGIPIKGFKNTTNYGMGEKVGFVCQSGYIQVGSHVRECLPDHTWSGTETKCLGPYDFDDDLHVRNILQEKVAQKAEEQRIELSRFQELQHALETGGMPQGKVLNLNFPGRLILYFAFDVSGSVGRQNFAKSIEFAKAIVKKVGISEHGARAGALTFSSKADEQFLPLHFNTTEGVLDALDKINFTGGGTAASSAFSLIRREYMPLVEELLGKINVKSVIFLLTDGKANMGGSPAEEADILKKAGVEVYCIGITGDVRKKTLYDLASKSTNDIGEEYPNVYILKNYATLAWIVQEITNGTVDYSQCGLGLENVGNAGSRGRVVGGRNVTKDPWPWMAALYMQSGKDIPPKYELKCGGSIINRHFILTAAHCMFNNLHTNPELRERKSIIIKLGLTDTKNETFVQESVAVKIFVHPKYRPGSFFDYDIALLQTERPIEYNPFVRPVCLPPKELPYGSLLYSPKSSAWATGWGHEGKVRINLNDILKMRTTQILKEIYLPLQSRERCLKSIRSNGVNESFFTDRMFCAGDGKGGNDTCQGDSGGPLMQSQSNSEGYIYWTQIGIVSWGIGCGLQNTYGYYTHLLNLMPWVEDTMENALRDMNR